MLNNALDNSECFSRVEIEIVQNSILVQTVRYSQLCICLLLNIVFMMLHNAARPGKTIILTFKRF